MKTLSVTFRNWALIPAMAGLTLLAPVAGGDGPEEGEREHRDGRETPSNYEHFDHFERMTHDLELREDQQASIKAIHEKSRVEREKMMHANRELQNKLEALQKEADGDEEEMIRIGQELGGLRVRMGLVNKRAQIEIAAALDEKQRIKFDEARNRMRKFHGKGKGKGMEGGGPEDMDMRARKHQEMKEKMKEMSPQERHEFMDRHRGDFQEKKEAHDKKFQDSNLRPDEHREFKERHRGDFQEKKEAHDKKFQDPQDLNHNEHRELPKGEKGQRDEGATKREKR